ncbi:hypothetical protein [Luteolibacter sp. AS25]|uniref:hypothetical protein n=1 Tax=Luteolibacter sp. AS25 TaxID=3135776 RepID=UPI00398A67DD
MKPAFLLSLPLIGCLALSSCYVVPDRPADKQKPKPKSEVESLTSQDQQKIQEQRDRMKAAENRKQAEQQKVEKREDTTTTTPDKPASEKRTDYPFANPVPGKEGFVFSPFNNKLVDVRDIPSGTLVQDPTYPASEKKYFRVP